MTPEPTSLLEHGFTPPRRSAEHGFTLSRRSAEHGFTPPRRSAEHGFTLVELMVVLVVIGLASAAAVLAIPDQHGRLADEATLFANRVRAAHDAAIVAGQPVSLWVAATGYGFDERLAGRWLPMTDAGLRVAQWKPGTRATLPGTASRTRVMFDATGLADRPLTVPLVRDRYEVSITVAGDGSVRVRV